MEQEFVLNVGPEATGMRLDVFLSDFSRRSGLGFSRHKLQELIQQGKVSVQGQVISKAHYQVKSGQEIRFFLRQEKTSSLDPEDIPLEIVFEDEDIALINKPAGLVVHPSAGHPNHTLVNALLKHLSSISDVNPSRPGIVHRLDKDTSGILVVAKNNFSHLELARQFSEHSIERIYVALVKGKMGFDEDTIEIPIGRHRTRRQDMSCILAKNLRYAKTYYRTLLRGDDFSLLELKPFTGRTHQLRVHLAFLGHPILGDRKYGRQNPFCRLALHAKTLGFIHPRSKKYLEFSVPIPKEFLDYLEKNRLPAPKEML